MRLHMGLVVCLSALVSFAFLSIPVRAEQSCESLKSVKIPNVTITSATALNPGWELPEQTGFVKVAAGTKLSVPACRIEAYSAPTGDSHIGFEVWLPAAANWNGKFLAVGNPGFIGSLSRGALANNVAKGYASAATDTGHVDERFNWAIGHPEKWADWGHRAVHETAVAAKQLIQSYYGKPPQYSYWNSCHNGGNQGLNEAQRYPGDFDGIIAGDPAFYISHLQSGSLYLSWVALKDGEKSPGYIPPAKYAVIHRAVLDKCDGLDGLVDGLIENDPAVCKFDPKSIQCPANTDSASCLTAAQVETAKKIYAGAKFADGTQIYSGLEPGSELGWALMAKGPDPFWVNYDYFKGMVFQDPNWNFRTFNVDRDVRVAESRTGAAVDAHNPDLTNFKKAGGKLIMYQSWAEAGVPPRTLTQYYKNIEDAMGGRKQTEDFARLFVVPGSGGCSVSALEEIQQWVEKGVAPEKVIFSHRDQGKVYRTRPVCAYPNVARYKGTGDPNDAANFTCAKVTVTTVP